MMRKGFIGVPGRIATAAMSGGSDAIIKLVKAVPYLTYD